eukprot:JP437578.1.p1 GENE.JP437578.1~~JP437578.1.p1  ORF type:complete len:143 (+),score=38.57 JP437578.1:61-429(+)
MRETAKDIRLFVDLPGVKKSDIKVDMRGDMICVSGQRKEVMDDISGDDDGAEDQQRLLAPAKEHGFRRMAQSFSEYSQERCFGLPKGCDPAGIKAKHEDGVLSIIIPKPESEKFPGMKINIE